MNLDNLFEELSVTELEDRLELAGRCTCRSGGDGGSGPGSPGGGGGTVDIPIGGGGGGGGTDIPVDTPIFVPAN